MSTWYQLEWSDNGLHHILQLKMHVVFDISRTLYRTVPTHPSLSKTSTWKYDCMNSFLFSLCHLHSSFCLFLFSYLLLLSPQFVLAVVCPLEKERIVLLVIVCVCVCARVCVCEIQCLQKMLQYTDQLHACHIP